MNKIKKIIIIIFINSFWNSNNQVLTTAVARYKEDNSHEIMTANSPNTENLKSDIKSTIMFATKYCIHSVFVGFMNVLTFL